MSEQLPLKQSCTIIWAQRKDRIFLTAEIEDLQIEQMNCQNNQFTLKGANSLNRYELKLELFADLKWDDHKRVESSRHVELVLPKLEDKWWPRLLKSTSKVQWIKSDFDKWIDEEEANEAEAEFKNPFASYLDGGGKLLIVLLLTFLMFRSSIKAVPVPRR
jgi:prostaglandin-E synthase